jgi:hypothetical protein
MAIIYLVSGGLTSPPYQILAYIIQLQAILPLQVVGITVAPVMGIIITDLLSNDLPLPRKKNIKFGFTIRNYSLINTFNAGKSTKLT